VTYAIAHIRGGGGGISATSGDGGSSSVAFAAGTKTANGGGKNVEPTTADAYGNAGATNSGFGAIKTRSNDSSVVIGGNGAYIVAGGAVTPSTGITVTVGAGGTAGSNGLAGGSGYVWIEYQV
jgi:hypothetical protein